MTDLTPRQRQIYEFLRDKIQNRGYGPTVREMCTEFGIKSPNGVVCHLKALEKKGLIIRNSKQARAIELVEEPEGNGLPMVGVVAAGLTTLAFEQNERIDFGEMFTNSRSEHFVLRVQGESMIEAQIADGDFVVIRRQETARSGEMVVAQTNEEGEATLKYWFPEQNRIRLQPANSSMDPIYVSSARVLGVVTGVVRQM